MRYLFLLSLLVFISCDGNEENIKKRQEAVREEMGSIKAVYYETSDSIDRVKRADTSAATLVKINKIAAVAESQKSVKLLPLQKEYDSLQALLEKD